jgi:Domain of unknown function (DUF4376)
MSFFLIYNPTTGVIQGSYTFSHPDGLDSVMAANTPAGMSALQVEADDPVLVNQSGWLVQDGALTAVTVTDAQQLATTQATQLGILTNSYNAAKTANVSYMGTAFMADPDSQEMFAHALEAYNAVGATPSDFFAVDANYTKVPMTLDQLKGLITAISAQVWAAFQQWVTVKQALAAATTVADAQAIVWA